MRVGEYLHPYTLIQSEEKHATFNEHATAPSTLTYHAELFGKT